MKRISLTPNLNNYKLNYFIEKQLRKQQIDNYFAYLVRESQRIKKISEMYKHEREQDAYYVACYLWIKHSYNITHNKTTVSYRGKDYIIDFSYSKFVLLNRNKPLCKLQIA